MQRISAAKLLEALFEQLDGGNANSRLHCSMAFSHDQLPKAFEQICCCNAQAILCLLLAAQQSFCFPTRPAEQQLNIGPQVRSFALSKLGDVAAALCILQENAQHYCSLWLLSQDQFVHKIGVDWPFLGTQGVGCVSVSIVPSATSLLF